MALCRPLRALCRPPLSQTLLLRSLILPAKVCEDYDRTFESCVIVSGAHINHEEEVQDEQEYSDTELGAVEEHKSIILHLLSQLKLGMDLTKVFDSVDHGFVNSFVFLRLSCRRSSWRNDLCWNCLQTAWLIRTSSYGIN